MAQKPPPPKLLAQFSKRLAALREERKLQASQLAALAGIHRQAIYKLEAGEILPTWATVIALANALNCSTEEFRDKGDRHETRTTAALDEVRDWLASSPLAARKRRRKA